MTRMVFASAFGVTLTLVAGCHGRPSAKVGRAVPRGGRMGGVIAGPGAEQPLAEEARLVQLPPLKGRLSMKCPEGERRFAYCSFRQPQQGGFLVCLSRCESGNCSPLLRARVHLPDARFELRSTDGANAAFHLEYYPGTYGHELWLSFWTRRYRYSLGNLPGPRIPCGSGTRCPTDDFFGVKRRPASGEGAGVERKWNCYSAVRLLYDLVVLRRRGKLRVPGMDR